MGRFLLFPGKIVQTRHMAEAIAAVPKRNLEVNECLLKHIHGDFSGMEFAEDRKLNEEAFESGEGRVFTDFQTSFGKIWIITDQRKCVMDNTTTILFPEDY